MLAKKVGESWRKLDVQLVAYGSGGGAGRHTVFCGASEGGRRSRSPKFYFRSVSTLSERSCKSGNSSDTENLSRNQKKRAQKQTVRRENATSSDWALCGKRRGREKRKVSVVYRKFPVDLPTPRQKSSNNVPDRALPSLVALRGQQGPADRPRREEGIVSPPTDKVDRESTPQIPFLAFSPVREA